MNLCPRFPLAQRLAILGMVLFGCLLVSLVSPVAAAPRLESLDWDTYWAQLAETGRQLDQISALAEADQLPALAALGDQWERVDAVTLSDGRSLPIDHGHLVSLLRADPPDPNRAGQVVHTMLQTQADLIQRTGADGDLTQLQQILARPEYQYPDQPVLSEDLLQRFLEWTLELIEQMGWLRWPLTFVVVAALGGVLIYMFRNSLLQMISDAEVETDRPGGSEILTANRALRQAEEYSTSGDFRTAVRYLYLSSLLLLEERGLLRYDHTQTNREYLRSAAQRPELARILAEVIDVFDRVWYGFQQIDETTYRRYADQVNRLKEQK